MIHPTTGMAEAGHRLKMERLRRGLSLREVGEAVGRKYAAIWHIEDGRVRPSEDCLRRLADLYGEDADELMLLSGTMPSDMLEYLARNPSIVRAIRREMAEVMRT